MTISISSADTIDVVSQHTGSFKTSADRRREIEDQIKHFLKCGGVIQEIPIGVSGMDPLNPGLVIRYGRPQIHSLDTYKVEDDDN